MDNGNFRTTKPTRYIPTIDRLNISVKYSAINGINAVVIISCKKLLINRTFKVVLKRFINNYTPIHIYTHYHLYKIYY